jgi:hypothetical protein
MSSSTILDRLHLQVLTGRLGLEVTGVDAEAGVLVFDDGGQTFLLEHGGSLDPEYLSVTLGYPGRALNGGADPEPQLLAQLAERASATFKLVTVRVADGTVLASCELLAAPPSALPTADFLVAVLPRAISTTRAAIERVHQDLQLHGITNATTT